MLHAEARRGARRDAAGDYVPLAEQDPARWDARDDRRGRSAAAPRQRAAARSAASSSKRRCSRRTSIRRRTGARRLGGDRRALRRAVRADRLAGGGDQPRGGDGARRTAPPPAWRRSTRWPATRGCADYQPYWAARAGLLARAGDAGAAQRRPTSWRSAWSATRRCGASCRQRAAPREPAALAARDVGRHAAPGPVDARPHVGVTPGAGLTVGLDVVRAACTSALSPNRRMRTSSACSCDTAEGCATRCRNAARSDSVPAGLLLTKSLDTCWSNHAASEAPTARMNSWFSRRKRARSLPPGARLGGWSGCRTSWASRFRRS